MVPCCQKNKVVPPHSPLASDPETDAHEPRGSPIVHLFPLSLAKRNMASVISILCFGSPKILSLQFDRNEVILTERQILEYFNLGNKNVSLRWDHGEVERLKITKNMFGFLLKASTSREFTMHTFSMPEEP